MLNLSLFIMLGCAHNGGDTDTDTDTNVDHEATLRTVNLSPDSPPVNILQGQKTTPVVKGLAYQDIDSAPLQPSQQASFEVVPTGGTAADSVLTVDNVHLTAGRTTNLVLFDHFAVLEALTFVEDDSNVPNGQVRLTFANVAAGFGAMDVVTINPDDAIITGLGFGEDEAVEIPLPGFDTMIGLDEDADGIVDATFALPDLTTTKADHFDVYIAADPYLLFVAPDDTAVRIDPTPAPPGTTGG